MGRATVAELRAAQGAAAVFTVETSVAGGVRGSASATEQRLHERREPVAREA